jgi:MarR family transcriptional regulator, 2-MHQ and catechol-resistance regulon repressor
MADGTSTASGVHLWLVLMKAHRSLARHAARSVSAFGLGISDFAILELLLHKGPQNVNEIGRRVELTSGAITSAVDRLEARELVVRGAHATDRRSRVVRLTPLGTAEITKVFAMHTSAMNDAVGGLGKSERGTLTQLLKKLGTSADERLVADDDER